MVCLGNICRSPMAEGILANKIKQLHLDWEVDSAGTDNWHIGETPDLRAQHITSINNIDISNQRARQFSRGDFDHYDLILTMDGDNYSTVQKQANGDGHMQKVRMILDYISPGNKLNVPDPYWDDDGFEKVFDMLNSACDALIRSFINQSEPAS